MFSEVAGRLGRYREAENLLVRCLELAPAFNAARYNYAMALYRQNKSVAALQQIDILTASEPRNSGYRNLKAVVLANIGDYQESLEIYADVLAKHPDQSKIWMSYGHALATAGRHRGQHRGLSPLHCSGADDGRGVLQSSQPQDLSIRRGRRAGDACAPRRHEHQQRGPLPIPLRHRQGPRGFRGLCRVVRALRRRQQAQAAQARL